MADDEPSAGRNRIRRRGRPWWALAVVAGTLVVVGVAILGVVIGQHWAAPAKIPAAAAGPSPSPSAAGPTELRWVKFRDPRSGVTLAYPAAWTRLQPSDPQVALLVTNGTLESLLVRARPRTAAQIPTAEQLADRIQASNESVQLLTEPEPIKLAGLPGYFFFYTFTDPVTGQTGAHSHYFLFTADTTLTLVFQAIPAAQFPEAAPVFDTIASTVRVRRG